MAEAKKCDVCGNYYIPLTEKSSIEGNQIIKLCVHRYRKLTYGEARIIKEKKDICASCSSTLKELLKIY